MLMRQITIRMPDEMHKAIVLWAKLSERSFNAQVVWILKKWIAHQGVTDARLPVELGGLPPTEKQEGGSGDAA